MKTYDERYESIASKIEVQRKVLRRKSILIVSGQMMLLFAAVVIPMLVLMMIPYKVELPDVSMYADSPYYSLIQRINEATTPKPKYNSYFDLVVDYFFGKKTSSTTIHCGFASEPGLEFIDNQTEGVIQEDIIQYSDQYIYYLKDECLYICPINGSEFELEDDYSLKEPWAKTDNMGMYLSQDGTTITVVCSCEMGRGKYCTRIINLDVSDPLNIRETGRIYVSGTFLSSRMVDDKLLLMSRFQIASNKDFSDESTFLPQIGQPGNMTSVAPGDIVVSEDFDDTYYTVVCMLDGNTLAVEDSAAYLSYSKAVYVSENNLFLYDSYAKKDNGESNEYVTDISCLSYGEDGLAHKGSVTVDGYPRDWYSMDEHEGILRVVTTVSNGQNSTSQNASLYCVSLTDFKVVASVEKFVAAGKSANRVRFDEDYVYVYTPTMRELTDPVYFFDLSNLNHITYKQTSINGGETRNLVGFGDGYLLGMNDTNNKYAKVEIYTQNKESITYLCDYKTNRVYDYYKSCMIDRENQLIGFVGKDADTGEYAYILLRFDGSSLQEVVKVPTEFSDYYFIRAVLIDGYLYVFGAEFSWAGFEVVQVG